MQAKIRDAKDGARMEDIADEFKLQFVEAMIAAYGLTFKQVVQLLHIGGGLRAKLQKMRATKSGHQPRGTTLTVRPPS